MTDSGDVNLDRVQLIMSELGDVEDEIFKKRQQNELAFKQREKDKKRRLQAISNFKPKWIDPNWTVCTYGMSLSQMFPLILFTFEDITISSYILITALRQRG